MSDLESQHTREELDKSEDEEIQLINESRPPKLDKETIKRYLKTRFTELLPTKQQMKQNKHLLNPLPGLRMMGRRQWLMFLSAFCAWTWDAYDFFTVSLNTVQLAKDFDKNVKDITWGITLVLMLRSVGGITFGYLGDRYGRKWPLVANLLIVCILEIGSGFIKTYRQFLGVRALFGICLGGVYGNATATALDDCPTEARGFIGGLLQQGYAFGYLLAVVFKRAIADNSSHKWRATFWFGAGISFLFALFRASLPETKAFLRKKEIERYNKEHGIYQPTFQMKIVESLKNYWLMMIYLVLFMSGFSFMSHSSQDLYPTLLTVRYSFSENKATVTNCVANIGAFIGGVFTGHISNFLGRRLTIMLICIFGGALIYPWAFIDGTGINAGVFFLQWCVQGGLGVVPSHLSELAPPDLRAFVVGISYQLGNLAASASSTIETTIGEQFPMTSPSGEPIYDYAKVMAIFVGCVFAFVLIVTLFGPERRNASFENAVTTNEEFGNSAGAVDKIEHVEECIVSKHARNQQC